MQPLIFELDQRQRFQGLASAVSSATFRRRIIVTVTTAARGETASTAGFYRSSNEQRGGSTISDGAVSGISA